MRGYLEKSSVALHIEIWQRLGIDGMLKYVTSQSAGLGIIIELGLECFYLFDENGIPGKVFFDDF